MKKSLLIAIGALIILLIGGWLLFRDQEPDVVLFDSDGNTSDVTIFDSQAAIDAEERNDRAVTIQEYVTKNLTSLSTEAGFPEVLGGTFLVTKFEAKGGKGFVSYEDGHNAYTADFTYTTDAKGLVSIKSFVVRK